MLQAEVQAPQPQPDCTEVFPDYMASSFPQPGEELPQELLPPPESREGFWREGEQQAAFGSTQVGIAPVGPLLWQRRSAWSPFLPFLPSPSFQPGPSGQRTRKVLALTG